MICKFDESYKYVLVKRNGRVSSREIFTIFDDSYSRANNY